MASKVSVVEMPLLSLSSFALAFEFLLFQMIVSLCCLMEHHNTIGSVLSLYCLVTIVCCPLSFVLLLLI